MKKLLLLFLVFLGFDVFPQGAPACPAVTTGPTQSICNGQSATLTSTLVTALKTTSYSVSSIPYVPYSYTAGTALVVGQDDIWSPVQNLLFPFCYYNNTYTKCVVGANGHITFDQTQANGIDNYQVTTALPSTTDMPANCINAVFRDIDPAYGGTGTGIYYQTGGTAPCRYVVISWYNIKLYKPGSGTNCKTAYPASTFQLVLYENTNYIDVYIEGTYSCSSWQNGYGIVGLLSPSGTAALCPPGRNRAAFTTTNEAWRFTPTGAAAYTLNWSSPSSTNFSTATSVAVTPSITTTYTASMVITNCDGTSFTTTATQQVVVNNSPTVTVNSASICGGTPATLTAGGATTYSWTPSTGLSGTTGSSVSANPGTTTVYSVTGTAAGCSSTVPSTVSVVANPTITVTSATTCPGSPVVLTASGSTSYTWSSGATTSTISVSPATATSYTVTGGTGTCTNIAVSNVSIAPSLAVLVNSGTICAGTSTVLTASGATTYSWTPSTGLSATTGGSVTANPVSTTTYTVTGTTGGCTGTGTSIVTINPTPTVTVVSPTVCAGNSAVITASGATTYSWNTGATTNSITVTPGATTYTVTGTTTSCTNAAVATVTVIAKPTVTVTSPSVCAGNSVSITANGATTYSWNTGATTNNITVSPGATSCTVTGTTATCTNTAVSTVSVVPNPTVTVNSMLICVGTTATLTAAGATSYSWSTGATTNPITTSPPIGTSSYTVTGTSSSCTNTAVSTVTVVSTPTVTVNSPTICVGSAATLTASGAATYSWSTGSTANPLSISPAATTTYTVVGAAGTCTASSTGVVTVNSIPVVTASSASVCIGSATTITAGGATTYSWSTGATTNTITASPTATTSYTVNGTTNNCTNTAVGTITANQVPTLTVTSASICNGAGFATLGVAGANTYTWSGGNITGSNSTAPTDNPAAATIYTVNGTSAQGCSAMATGTITVINNPTVSVNSGSICSGQTTLTLTANSNANSFVWSPATGLSATTGSLVTANPTTTQTYTIVGTAGTCTVGTTATVSVNTPPIVTTTSSTICVGQQTSTLGVNGANTYTWTGGGITGSNSTNPTDNPISTTIYTVNAIDANTCTGTASATITVNSLPTVNSTSTSVCPGNAGTITASGASTYTWSTATPGANLTQTPASTTNYTVIGADINTCTNTAVGTINVYNAFGISVNSAAICAAGQQTATLTATGASTYIWNPATGLSASTGSVVTTIPSAASTIYTVTGTSAVGSCTAVTTSTLTINQLPVATATSNTPCASQQALNLNCSVVPAGTYTYNWSGPNSFTSAAQNPAIATANVTASTAGIYTVAVVDGNMCVNAAIVSVAVNSLPNVTATSGTICMGSTTTLTAGGATTYSWSPSTGLNQTTGSAVSANPTSAQNYIITGTDINGCTSAAFSQVTVNALPAVSATSGTICLGQQTATLTASGAATYTWMPSNSLSLGTGAIVEGFPYANTIYTITATNVSGCVSTATTSITVIPLPTVHTNTVSPECIPLATTFTATPTPTGAYTYSWTLGNGQTSTLTHPTATYTIASNYTVKIIITDANGCTASASTVINALSIPIADFDYGPQPISVLTPEVQFTNESTPGLPIHNWNFGDVLCPVSTNTSSVNNPSHTYSDVGTYNVTLTVATANGCSATVIKPVVINEDFAIYVPNAFSPNSDGKNEVFKAEGEGFTDFRLYIFDRWGLLLFYSDDINKGWDGSLQGKGGNIVQEDVYVWKIELKDFKHNSKSLTGNVTVVK